jgi:Cu-Zn family superoxide dismutase
MIRSLFVAAAVAALPLAAAAQDTAKAEIVDKAGKRIGAATFTEAPKGIVIRLELQGLPPGYKGIHLHSTGTCEDHDHGFQASKGHLNPDNRKHGLMNPEGPDAGDLPNVYVHADGKAAAEIFTMLASIKGAAGRPALLDADGAALVVHANPDDHMSQPIGGAGARIACGVIK